MLLNKGVDIEYEYEEKGVRRVTPLMYASNHEMVEMLLAAGANPNHLTPGTNSYLFSAVGLADEWWTRALLKAGAEVNQVSGLTGNTVLQTAVMQLSTKRLPLAYLLLDAGARADFGDPVRNDKMMSEACTSGKIALVKALIDAGARVDPSDDSMLPPLSAAAGKGSLDIMSLLLDQGAQVNAVHHNRDIWHEDKGNGLGPDVDRTLVEMNYTALLYAAKLNNLNALKLLLRSGATVGAELHSGIAALQVVVDGGQHELDVRTALHKRQYAEKLSERDKAPALIDHFERETKSPDKLPVMNTAGDCGSVECLIDPLWKASRQQHSNRSPDRKVHEDAVKVIELKPDKTLGESVIDVIDINPVVTVESVEEYGARKLGHE